jgi:hypothetical protein
MIENDAQKPKSYSPHMKSNAPKEASESRVCEELDIEGG